MTQNGTHFFLIVAGPSDAAPSVEDAGTEPGAALALLSRKEAELATTPAEVVLLGADSIETLTRTHSSYFGAAAGLGRALAGPGA